MQPANRESQMVNASQLHQSRLGLLSQALMMIITTGFLFAETLEEFWKTKYVNVMFTACYCMLLYISIPELT